jgi:hypothetical protein
MAERVTWVVDRIEGEWAVVEIAAGHTVQLPLAWLPPGAGEGAHLRVTHEPAADSSMLTLKIEPRASLRGSAERKPLVKPGRGDPGGNINL